MNIDPHVFAALKGETLVTNGMCIFGETVGHDGRPTTYSALGGMELVIRRAVVTESPFNNGEPSLSFELTDKSSPRAFKVARFTAAEIIKLFHSKDDPDFMHQFGEICLRAFAPETPSQPQPQTPSAAQDGWGAWA